MAKRIERDGKFYRIRRGKEIDEELRRATIGRSVTPVTDEQLDALYFADLHNVDMDDEGAIAFCDCENCAE